MTTHFVHVMDQLEFEIVAPDTGGGREAIVLHLPLNVLANTFQLGQCQSPGCSHMPASSLAACLTKSGFNLRRLLAWADPVTGKSTRESKESL